MKQVLLKLLLADAIICVLLSFLTGTYADTLTMLFTSVFIFIVSIVLSCIMSFIIKLKKYALPMLLNSIMLPCIIYIIYGISSSCRIHNLYVMYHFDTLEGEYQIYIHKDSNAFDINRTFEGGSEGVIHGTYFRIRDNEYKLYVPNTYYCNGMNNELLIKNDSIHGFNGASYSIHSKERIRAR